MRKYFLNALLLIFFGSFFINACAAENSHENAKISVVIPVYNVENYLRECMDSVIGQSHKNLEIICVNDGSTDSSLQILKDYQNKDDRIKIIDQKNKGVSSARNMGIKIAKGEYITFVDPDDILSLNAYETALNKIKSNVDILVWGYKAFPNAGGWWLKAGQSSNKVYNDKIVDAFFNGESASVVVWNKFYRNKMLKENNLNFNEALKTSEDVEFNMLSFVRAKKIQFINDRLYNYRIKRKDSLTDIYKGKSQANNHKILFKNVLENWHKLGFLKNNEHKVLKYFTRISYNVINSITDASFKKEYASELLSIFWQHMSEDIKYKLDPNTMDKLSFIQKIA